MDLTEKRRANIAKILINVGSIVFTTAVVSNFTTSWNVIRLAVGAAITGLCLWGAIWIEK